MPDLVRKLARLDAQSLTDVIVAQGALLRAAWLTRREPIGSLTTNLRAPTAPLSGDPARARAIGLAVSRAAEYGVFRPFCLVRALAIRALLERQGITGSEIRIGVRRRKKFEAHAWVRWGDEIIGDQAWHIASFTEVDDIRVLGGS